MLVLLLLIIGSHAGPPAGGYDQPSTHQVLEAELIVPQLEITETVFDTNLDTFKDVIAQELVGLNQFGLIDVLTKDDITWVNASYPHLDFKWVAGYTIEDLENSLPQMELLCTAMNADSLFQGGGAFDVTLTNDCLLNYEGYSEIRNASLNGNCTSGDYEVSGINTGFPIYLNFSRSFFSVEQDAYNTSYINLDFRVPTMYFHNDQNVTGTGGTKRYNRAVAITFHDRNGTNWKTDACFGTRNNYEHCPTSMHQWRYEDDDQCSQRLQGKLPFLDLLYEGGADPDNVIVLNNTRMINGYPTPTWDLYMVALVETWSGFIQESNLSGNGDLYFNNPYNPNSTRTDWDGHLEINAERYSFYILPFRVSWPQMITIDASDTVSNVGRLVVLQAVVIQRQLEINFAPDFAAGEKFGVLHITIRTQTQFPFGLRNDTDPFAPALSTKVSGAAANNPTFRDSDHYSTCANVAPNEYCYQEWHLEILPTLCDVTGVYELEFWAACFNMTECALDNNIHDTPIQNKRMSNAWSGIMTYSINSQEFCPEIIDEIQIQGTISKYIDPEFLEPAIPGTNLFSNDHVYFETTFLSRTAKANNAFSAGDDSLIEFVRPYSISMEVTLLAEPFQTIVNSDNGDITFPDVANTKNYVINLCSVPRLNFPYESIPNGVQGDCFKSLGWNAANLLDFKNWTATNGTHTLNTIDTNEIAFSLRLDERVIPVDVANTNTQIIISMSLEIFYVGNQNWGENPTNNWGAAYGGRRHLKVELPQGTARRQLQDGSQGRLQGAQVQDMFTVPRRPGLLYCPLKSVLTSAGFVLDVLMNPMEIPSSEREALEDVFIMQSKLGGHLGINPTQTIKVYQVDSCSNDNCAQVYPSARRSLQDIRYARYYVDIKHLNGAVRFQELLMHQNSELYEEDGLFFNKLVKEMKIDHCSPEAQVVFNDYRTQNVDPMVTAVDDSSVASIAIFFTTLLAFFYF